MCYTGVTHLTLVLRRKKILMMSNEEWERKMEFLLNQQAKFDAMPQGGKKKKEN